MAERKEPQSYGSQGEWLSGKTGQKVDQEKGGFPNEREEESAPHQGGDTSPVQAMETSSTPPSSSASTPVVSGGNVSGKESGAKRGGFFKERDYK